MPGEVHIQDITRVIQLAVAPVFLLTAVGSLLGVFSNRLARIVDRSRAIDGRLSSLPEPERRPLAAERRTLERRARVVRLAIILATAAALLVCLLIACAFLGFILRVDFARLVAGLFIAAVAALTGALTSYLREVLLAIGAMRAMLPLPPFGAGRSEP